MLGMQHVIGNPWAWPQWHANTVHMSLCMWSKTWKSTQFSQVHVPVWITRLCITKGCRRAQLSPNLKRSQTNFVPAWHMYNRTLQLLSLLDSNNMCISTTSYLQGVWRIIVVAWGGAYANTGRIITGLTCCFQGASCRAVYFRSLHNTRGLLGQTGRVLGGMHTWHLGYFCLFTEGCNCISQAV